jgi:hypothetical protein
MDFRKYKLEAIPSPTNKKDYSLDMFVANMPSLMEPAEPAKAKYFTKSIYDQGPYGMCVDFAIRALAECFLQGELGDEYKEYIEIANGYLYGNRGTKDHQGEGLVGVQALNVWRKEGIPRRKDFNVVGDYATCRAAVEVRKKDLLNLAMAQRIKSFVRLRGVHEISAFIKMTGFPVLLMIPIYENFYSGDASSKGIIPYPSGALLGYHEILGTEVFYRDSMARVRFQNSWSSYWGNSGFGDIDPSMISEAWGVLDAYPESLDNYPTEMVFQIGNNKVITDIGTIVLTDKEKPILHDDTTKIGIRVPFETIGWYVDWYQNIEIINNEKVYKDFIHIHKYPSDEKLLEQFGIKR